MRTGGLLGLARSFIGNALRSLGIVVGQACAAAADVIDPPREWNPRLWDRDGDPRADNEDRRP